MWSPENIRALRKRFGENVEEFAARFRVSAEAVKKWEKQPGKGGSPPSGPATVILDLLHEKIEAESLAGA